MDGQFEESELITVIEARYELVQVKQQKYSCKCGGCIETALGPERALPGSRYSLAFAIKVVLDKWLDHIPLERQCRILERYGLVVTSQTLWDLANAIAHRLERVNVALLDHVLGRPVIGLDQTSWPRLEGAGSKPWQMWCLTAQGIVVHRTREDKSTATFTDLVGKWPRNAPRRTQGAEPVRAPRHARQRVGMVRGRHAPIRRPRDGSCVWQPRPVPGPSRRVVERLRGKRARGVPLRGPAQLP
jgi:transposase